MKAGSRRLGFSWATWASPGSHPGARWPSPANPRLKTEKSAKSDEKNRKKAVFLDPMLGRLKIPKIRKIRPGQVLKPPKSPRSASEGSWRGRKFSEKTTPKKINFRIHRKRSHGQQHKPWEPCACFPDYGRRTLNSLKLLLSSLSTSLSSSLSLLSSSLSFFSHSLALSLLNIESRKSLRHSGSKNKSSPLLDSETEYLIII